MVSLDLFLSEPIDHFTLRFRMQGSAELTADLPCPVVSGYAVRTKPLARRTHMVRVCEAERR